MIISGSYDLLSNFGETPPIGAILFEHDGTIRFVAIDSSSENDIADVILLNDFFQYALGKTEWIKSFANASAESLDRKNKKAMTPKLRIIQGGLSQVTSSNAL